MPTIRSEALWAGTEASFSDYIKAMAGADAYALQPSSEEPNSTPYLLEVQGNIGVVSIRGPLTNKDAWYNEYIGVTSYNAIREALIHAAQDPAVEQILLEIDSGGGAVAGVADTANLIRMVNDQFKPVIAFTDGTMASAAYWMGSSAGKVYASKTAMVGSIGVIATHMEQSKALKDAGIGVTVIRSGKFKALVNGVEPLTAAAEAQLQAHLDEVYKVFVQHIAEMRNVSYDLADSQMAQGREFMGASAVGAGLVEGVTSYDNLFNTLSKEFIDTSVNVIDNKQKSSQQEWGMGKKALSGIEIAAMAEGAAAVVPEALTEAELLAAAATEAEAAAAEAAAAEAAEAEALAAAAAAAVPEAKELAAKADTSIVDYLQGLVKDKDSQLMASAIELQDLKKQLDGMQAAHSGLLEIAGKSLSNMQVALGGAAADVTGMSATQVLADHKRVSDLFSSKFKAGGVAAVDAASNPKSEQPVDAMTQARLASVRSK